MKLLLLSILAALIGQPVTSCSMTSCLLKCIFLSSEKTGHCKNDYCQCDTSDYKCHGMLGNLYLPGVGGKCEEESCRSLCLESEYEKQRENSTCDDNLCCCGNANEGHKIKNLGVVVVVLCITILYAHNTKNT